MDSDFAVFIMTMTAARYSCMTAARYSCMDDVLSIAAYDEVKTSVSMIQIVMSLQ